MQAIGLGLAIAWSAAARATPRVLQGEARQLTDRGAEAVRADVRYLAAPALEGRGALTSGLDQASRFVAARFAALGLLPAGERGTFFQAVHIPLPARPSIETRLALGDARLALGVDFVPNAGSAATRAAGPLAFVGDGLVVPGVRDDYAGLDVRGKVVLCLLPDPALTTRLLENAVARGAVGVLFVDAQPAPDPAAALAPLPAFTLEDVAAIASFHLSAAALDRLLAPRRTSVAELRAALTVGSPAAHDLPLPGWATFAVVWAPPSVEGRNVVGLLPGADPRLAGEAIVVGAHYDHLGHGDEGGALDGPRLHPGADDNASGIAALLAAAATLAGGGARPRRSILFVAFTGEEKGWAGSQVFASRPPRTVVAMLNLDMVGRMRANALEVNGSATSPEWRAIVETVNRTTALSSDRLALSFPREVPEGSDHQPFILNRVPALFFFTGMHCDYHRGGDTWDKINAAGVIDVSRLASGVARAVADRRRALTFAAPAWTQRPPAAACAP